MIRQNVQGVVINQIAKVRNVLLLRHYVLGARKLVITNICFKTIKVNCNSLEREDSDSDEQDIDDNIFLGTLTAEQCPDNCIDPNQVGTLSTQENNKVLI